MTGASMARRLTVLESVDARAGRGAGEDDAALGALVAAGAIDPARHIGADGTLTTAGRDHLLAWLRRAYKGGR